MTPRFLLCDADGCLFPSEEPAFVACAQVTNRLLESIGDPRRFGPEELRRTFVGMNFRALSLELAPDLAPGEHEEWVREEKRAVSAYLGEVLRPDERVLGPLTAVRAELAVVSSSALTRLDACFRATGLDALFPEQRRFSAEDSLPVPTSKPDPAVYAFAGEQLGVAGEEGLAVEDAVAGVRSAMAAGFPVVGLTLFVGEDEREERTQALLDAGADRVVGSWAEVCALIGPVQEARA